MKASETKIQPIIEGTKQYVIPLFQRAYSWNKKDWRNYHEKNKKYFQKIFNDINFNSIIRRSFSTN